MRFSLAASPDGDSDLTQKLAAALDAAGVPVDEGQADDEDTDIDVEAPVVPSEGRFFCWSLCVVKDKRTGMRWRGLSRQRFESIQIELFCVALREVRVFATLVCRSRMWTEINTINTGVKTKTEARNGTPTRDVRRKYVCTCYIYIMHMFYSPAFCFFNTAYSTFPSLPPPPPPPAKLEL